jgi:two-component system sensor histidine kinase KdpD
LREMALRRVAQRVDKDVTSYMRSRAIPGPWPASERVLALIGPDSSAENVVRHAARLADALRAPLVAFHIERADDNAHVQQALNLAVQLGGTVETTTAGDPAEAVLDYATRQNITHIVVGRGAKRPWWWRVGKRTLGEVLTRKAVAFALHFVPVPAAPVARPRLPRAELVWWPYAVSVLVLAIVTGAGVALHGRLPQEAAALIFTACIAGAASQFGRNVGLATAGVSFLAWDFFFLEPLYTFSVSDPRDVVAGRDASGSVGWHGGGSGGDDHGRRSDDC